MDKFNPAAAAKARDLDHPYVYDPDSPSGQVLAAIYALHDAEALLRSRLRAILGLGPSELIALQFIARHETIQTPPRPMDVARHLGLTSGAASIILRHLADRDFITRHQHPDDGRGQILRLTPTSWEQLRQAAGGDDRAALEQILTLPHRESRWIVALLTTMTSNLTNGTPDSGRDKTV